MTYTYQLEGMTCSSCEAKVKSNLLMLPNVTVVEVSKAENTATITMNKHISLASLQNAIGGINSKYQIVATQHSEVAEQAISWVTTYKPILLIFLYIILISGLASFVTPFRGQGGGFMQYFMAGFFLVFSFFKMLNLKGFADSYKMYDVVAKQVPVWAYLYPFIELALGIAYTINLNPFITNVITLVVMNISIIGVLKSVLYKEKIQCACLGAVFNLPMSTVTIIEDALMIAMSAIMLYQLI
ncbi:MAG: heavy-metal-associated domain-containing protein [Chitinophagaceae bacterium]